CAASTVSGSGTTLTVTWNVAFKTPSVPCAVKNIYLQAADDAGAYSGWRQKGTWLVGGELACGSLLPGSIDTSGEVDRITFCGQANHRVTLTLAAGGFPSFVTATATLFSPTGEQLLVFNANSQQQVTLAATGTYVIQIRASNFVSTGSYSLGLECLVPTSPVDAPLVCGSLERGAIDSAAEVDQLTFSGQANQQ